MARASVPGWRFVAFDAIGGRTFDRARFAAGDGFTQRDSAFGLAVRWFGCFAAWGFVQVDGVLAERLGACGSFAVRSSDLGSCPIRGSAARE